MGRADRLPSRFPCGTRFIIEGRAGHIVSRSLEFPDGRHVELPVAPMGPEQRARKSGRLDRRQDRATRA
jgi:hypothetical protein